MPNKWQVIRIAGAGLNVFVLLLLIYDFTVATDSWLKGYDAFAIILVGFVLFGIQMGFLNGLFKRLKKKHIPNFNEEK
jgi:hypothetical protein